MNIIPALHFDYPVQNPRHEIALAQPESVFQQDTEKALFGEDGFSFDDVLDAVNPLQHLPVVSSLYREVSGDSIAPLARMIGGFALGGPLGLIASFASVGLEAATGGDLGENFLALFDSDSPADSQYAHTQYGKIKKLIPS